MSVAQAFLDVWDASRKHRFPRWGSALLIMTGVAGMVVHYTLGLGLESGWRGDIGWGGGIMVVIGMSSIIGRFFPKNPATR